MFATNIVDRTDTGFERNGPQIGTSVNLQLNALNADAVDPDFLQFLPEAVIIYR